MAYDENLAARIRDHFGDDPDVVEKKMFGGVAYMYRGNMAVGINQDGLMVRLNAEDHESALAQTGVSEARMGAKTMRGWVVVEHETIGDDDTLATWIDRGVELAGSLPPK